MSVFEFDQSLQLGVQAIDEQHKRFIGYINDAWDALERGDDSEEYLYILNQLMDYAMEHFSFEESLMREFQYPGYDDHKQNHNRTAEQLFEFDMRLLAASPDDCRAFVQFLQDWLQNHIKVVDVELASFLKSKGVS
ncbi:bacteriohemerythrin [Motiliproteus sediminis]|uniref:bacteriohemerythrin n=1 Tax=Motiliproteus sediminis TaxID=1468178 RepID=UPI001AEFEABD|nr:bacteriohemerythrin [Motiliproteus sediminis]